MDIFLDTARAKEWKLLPGCPPIAGVTTNPTLIREAGLCVCLDDYLGLLGAAQAMKVPHLMLQLPSSDTNQCVAWAQTLQASATVLNVKLTFKLPCHVDWQAAHRALKARGFATLLTGVSNAMQLLWARAEGADYVAPYFGRLSAAGRDVNGLIDALLAVQLAGGPKLMAASVKTGDLFTLLLAKGASAVTAKPDFLYQLLEDEITQAAIVQFSKDCATR